LVIDCIFQRKLKRSARDHASFSEEENVPLKVLKQKKGKMNYSGDEDDDATPVKAKVFTMCVDVHMGGGGAPCCVW
jgi:hypothetical protein